MSQESFMNEKQKAIFAKEWEKTCEAINNPKDPNVKYNLKGIFRKYADCETSSGVRYGKVL